MVVGAYVEELTRKLAPASVKQHLAAIRMLFDWLVVGQGRGAAPMRARAVDKALRNGPLTYSGQR